MENYDSLQHQDKQGKNPPPVFKSALKRISNFPMLNYPLSIIICSVFLFILFLTGRQ